MQTILFDLDGVVIKKHYYFSCKFAEDFHIPLDQITTFFKTDFPACMTGHADLKEKITPYLAKWGWTKSVDQLLEYWFAYESNLDQDILGEIRKLRAAGQKCYLATNNEKYRTEYIKERLGLAKEFDGVFSSSGVGCTKSDSRFWTHICNTLKLSPSELVLWDDDQDNIDSATKDGLQAFFYTNFTDFQRTLSRLLKQPPVLTNPTNQS